jgi:hypothetical protein
MMMTVDFDFAGDDARDFDGYAVDRIPPTE